jgi:hypothetical protein
MSFTFPGHGVCSCPSKGFRVCLSTLVPTMGRCTSKQRVSKSHVCGSHLLQSIRLLVGNRCASMGFKQVWMPHCVVNCMVFFACYGAIILQAARVIKSISAALHDCTCPLRFALMLDTTMCEVKTWLKLQSCVMSAKSVVSN